MDLCRRAHDAPARWRTAALLMLVLGLSIPPPATAEGSIVDFARCLGKKGATMYGASWCPSCEAQLATFGKAAGYVEYVECSIQGTGFKTEECEAAEILTFPTWEFRDGSRLTGKQPLRRLAQKTGCPLPEDPLP